MDRVACRCGVFAVVIAVLAGWLAGPSRAVASGWSVEPMPNPPGLVDWGPTSVSCAAPRDCIADGIASGPVGAVAHWNGANWSIEPLEVLAGTGSGALTPWVSCIPHLGCVVVGADAPRGSGVRWSIPSFPASIDLSYASSGSLSCASPIACTAFGFSRLSEGKSTPPNPVVERWNGKHWTIQPTPTVGHNGSFDAVSCPSVTTCILVGSYPVPGGSRPLTERWNGTRWSLLRSPRGPSGCFIEAGYSPAFCSELRHVSCATPVACVAVGDYGGSFGHALTERWNGKKWSIQRTPRPPGRSGSILSGVSCASATACTAIGTEPGGPFAERWNGTSWTIQRTASPASPGAVLNAVSCPTPTDCAAVGSQSGGPLAERWTGHS